MVLIISGTNNNTRFLCSINNISHVEVAGMPWGLRWELVTGHNHRNCMYFDWGKFLVVLWRTGIRTYCSQREKRRAPNAQTDFRSYVISKYLPHERVSFGPAVITQLKFVYLFVTISPVEKRICTRGEVRVSSTVGWHAGRRRWPKFLNFVAVPRWPAVVTERRGKSGNWWAGRRSPSWGILFRPWSFIYAGSGGDRM